MMQYELLKTHIYRFTVHPLRTQWPDSDS